MLLAPWGERLGEGVMQETTFGLTPSPNLSPKGERNMNAMKGERRMQLGASLPVGDIGTGPTVLRAYAQAAEGLGFDYLVAPDPVVGGHPHQDYGGPRRGTTPTAHHHPFLL